MDACPVPSNFAHSQPKPASRKSTKSAKSALTDYVGSLPADKLELLDEALRIALGLE